MVQVPREVKASGGEKSVPLSWLGNDQVIRYSGGKNGASPQRGESIGWRKVPLSWLGDDQALWGKKRCKVPREDKHRVEKSLSWLVDDQALWGENGASPQGGQASGGEKSKSH